MSDQPDKKLVFGIEFHLTGNDAGHVVLPAIWPSAKAVQEAMQCDELEAMFADVLIWYDGFKDLKKLLVLKFMLDVDALKVIIEKRIRARDEKDYKTSDNLRDVLFGLKLNRFVFDGRTQWIRA